MGGNGGAGNLLGGGEPEVSDNLKGFGAVVKAFRRRAGLTQEEFAPKVRYSVPTVASIEQGRRYPPSDFVERAEEVLDAFGALRAAARHLSRQPGLASWFRQWAQLEAEAVTLYTYECRLIPGLVQTEAYARTLFEHRLPPLSDEDVEARLAARLERQRLLSERPRTAFSFILDEHLFLRQTGGAEVTRELLDHLLGISSVRNIDIQILPLTCGIHGGLNGPIMLLETPENRWFAYSEGQETGQLVSDLKPISVLQMRYAKLRSQALTSKDSKGLMERLRGAL
jgi:transcriptional regulator with XRE-family HTH domain